MRTLLFLIIIAFASNISAADGWRANEMEIKVLITCKDDALRLAGLHLHGEMYHSGYALMDVTPEELAQVQRLGLSFEITISDLNGYYRDFGFQKRMRKGIPPMSRSSQIWTACKRISPLFVKKPSSENRSRIEISVI